MFKIFSVKQSQQRREREKEAFGTYFHRPPHQLNLVVANAAEMIASVRIQFLVWNGAIFYDLLAADEADDEEKEGSMDAVESKRCQANDSLLRNPNPR